VDLKLQGKRALVTGSSAGIGAGIARMLAAEGVAVVVHGRNAERTAAVAAEMKSRGGSVAHVVGDLETDAGGEAVAKGALAAFGGIDILVNNAGGRGNGGAKNGWFEMSVRDWEQTYNMNVLSAVRMILPLAPPMKARGWGRIINISSLGAQATSGAVAEYGAAKNAMINMTLSLAKTLSKTGVTVNTVSPGMVRTAALEDLLKNVAIREGFGPDVEKGARWMLDNAMRQTVDRLGAAEDIAFAVCFLASPMSDFVNGANIRVDGGAAPAVN
jgi:NAD(P)-dependent dehydrogenase (short-subunit alcohol dehydrogenase family)